MRKFRTKTSNKRKFILNIFLFLFLLIGVGYSTIFTNLNIGGDLVLLNYRDLNLAQTSSTDNTAFRSDTYKTNIKTITIDDSINPPSNVIESWDISETGNGGVMAYIVQNPNDNTKYDLYIQGNGRIYTNQDSSYLFNGLTSLETINNLNKLNTNKTTNMSNMFNNCTNLAVLDLSNFNMSKVTNTTNMLNGMTNLIELTTPKTYPTDNNVTITLPTSLYKDTTEYTSINKTSPTSTLLKDDDRYLVTFDPNGGTTNVTQKVVTLGSTYGALPTPTREGYDFLGWNGKNMSSNEWRKGDWQGEGTNPTVRISTNQRIYIKKDETVTISYDYTKPYRWSAALFDTIDGTSYNRSISWEMNSTKGDYTYTAPKDTYLHFVWATDNLENTLLPEDLNNINCQVEKGNISTTYEPYYISNSTNITQNVNHTLKAIWKLAEYNYGTEGSYEFTAPVDGTYKIELWGAQGGNGSADEEDYVYLGGLGAYTKGIIDLEKNNKLYVYVGGQGSSPRYNYEAPSEGGYNGGGTGGYDEINDFASDAAGGGGGATDLRLVSGNWDNFNSLKSRIMVAAGAGGGAWNTRTRTAGENGGGLIIKNQEIGVANTTGILVSEGTQTTGYSFGTGQSQGFISSTGSASGGGGGGYYTGIVSTHTQGAGGTSFISGHNGCDAISESSTSTNIIHTGQSEHYSHKKFTDTVMIDGAGCKWTNQKTSDCSGQPQPDGTTTTGHAGIGYARITIISIDD